MCVRERERERKKHREKEREKKRKRERFHAVCLFLPTDTYLAGRITSRSSRKKCKEELEVVEVAVEAAGS